MAECSSSPLAVSILPGLDSKEIDALFSVVQPAAEFDRLPRLLAARNLVDSLSLLLGCRRLLHPPLHHRASSPPPYAVDLIPFITAEIPDLSTTAQALKILDSCGSDIIELGVPYSDPLADGPVIQAATTHSLAKETNFDSVIVMLKEAAATRSLAKCTNFDSVIAMLKKVIPQLSCPIGLFTYYNPILVWRGEIHDNFERYWNPL